MSVKELMRQADWGDLTPRLVLYASSRMKKMVWGAYRNQESAKGMEAADFVQDAIDKTLSGRRSWDFKNKPLANHLMDVVKSDISNLANSRENIITTILTENEKFHLALEWDTEFEVANKILIENFFEYIRKTAPDILYTAISIYRYDEKNPDQIAQANGNTVEQTKRDLRRLFRVTEDYREHLLFSLRGKNRASLAAEDEAENDT